MLGIIVSCLHMFRILHALISLISMWVLIILPGNVMSRTIHYINDLFNYVVIDGCAWLCLAMKKKPQQCISSKTKSTCQNSITSEHFQKRLKNQGVVLALSLSIVSCLHMFRILHALISLISMWVLIILPGNVMSRTIHYINDLFNYVVIDGCAWLCLATNMWKYS